jgi:hypothetical protein
LGLILPILANEAESVARSEVERVVTHPSGCWRGSDGRWYRPDDQPVGSNTEPEAERDLSIALAVVVSVIVIGSLARGDAGALTLLLGGIAGALFVRWRVFDRMHHGWATASVALCGTAGALPLVGLALH